MTKQLMLILDFGGQYNQLIARRIRELNIYCEVHPYKMTAAEIKELSPVGIILTGGPNSAYSHDAPKPDPAIFELGIPVLGICYGVQVMSQVLGGEVESAEKDEFGSTMLKMDTSSELFTGIKDAGTVWMSHRDHITRLPEGFVTVASTDYCNNAAIENTEKRLYGVQFHPEVDQAEHGTEMLRNFAYGICKATGDWSMHHYAEETINEIRAKVGSGKALLALSGGVDSSVCAQLMKKAIGRQLTCIFVDHGLMRKNEGNEIEEFFGGGDINFVRVDAEGRFLTRLAGVTDPETKRKIIGEEFIRVFEEEGKKIGTVDYLVQGTIYPDIIESGLGDAAVIKSHHNVGGLPDYVDFKEIIEPLKLLFKDEVRDLGRELGLADTLVSRQPFPGPGLAVRVIGEITREKLDILRDADYIFRNELESAGLAPEISQYFAVLTDMRSVGVKGDARTYDYTLALRAVTTTDFMTANWARIPYETLTKASSRITNEVKHINRIVYDITSKPPATIEWE